MQSVLRRKLSSKALLDVLVLSVFFTLASLVVYQHTRTSNVREQNSKFLSPVQLGIEAPRTASIAVSLNKNTNNHHCTMGACFDSSKCVNFKVYVYPEQESDQPASVLFRRIINVIKNSPYYTTDHSEACVLVPSFDTLDRDIHSKDYQAHLPQLSALEHWNNGRNHLIFNQYSGTWLDYSDLLDFDTGQAIVAKASFNDKYYRPGFDISFPLLHKEHPEKPGDLGLLHTNVSLLPIFRKYLLAFKGKRYLYGNGSETRSSVYHIHNGKDKVLLTTCKHNADWEKRQDKRCAEDNMLYEQYDYADLLVNSSYCLVPRGRRLGSFRFLEALQSSCVPVSLSNGYVLPFDEVIDWTQAALVIDERRLLQVPSIIRGIGSKKLLSLRLHTQHLWNTYFRSVERVVSTTLEIIKNRLAPRPLFVWNQSPGGLVYDPSFSAQSSAFPFYHTHSESPGEQYTAVITVSQPSTHEEAPLVNLIKSISPGDNLREIIIQWVGGGSPAVSLPPTKVPVRVVRCEECGPAEQLWTLDYVHTDAVLHLTENIKTTSDEIEFGFSVWQSFRDRLVGSIGHRHYWDQTRLHWKYSSRPSNNYSIILTDLLFYHRYYGYLLREATSPQLLQLANQNECLSIVLNFIVAEATGKRPIKITQQSHVTHKGISKATLMKIGQERVACLNKAADISRHVPLVSSVLRADPVLFRDDVSMIRKEFKRLEYNY